MSDLQDKAKAVYCSKIIIMMIMLVIVLPASADVAYVDDTLRVGVRAEPGTGLAPMEVIETGDMVDVLQRDDHYYRVRTAAGTEGWVAAKYMSADVPAKQKLQTVDEKNRQLQIELNKMQDKVATTDRLAEENSHLRREVSHLDNDSSWLFWFSGILAIGPLGFLLGLLWYRYQIMKKLGGLTL